MKQKTVSIFLTIVLLAFPSLLLAATAMLHWQPNTDPDLAGYKIYYGSQSRSYGFSIPVDKNVTTYTLNGLVEGKTYYFALTAVDLSGNESGYSVEVSKIIASNNNYIPLPAPDSYGMIKGGDQSHLNEVDFSFSGSGGNLRVSYQAWDVDYSKEVQIILNGYVLEYTQKTGNEKWGKTQTLFLPDQYVNDSAMNILKFNNTGNPPNTYWWGVRNISLTTGSETKGLRKGRKKGQQ